MIDLNILKPLELPCGYVLENRLAKAAMSENLANTLHQPSSELFRLYEEWSKTQLGLMLTGNVMIDEDHLNEPRNVAFPKDLKRTQNHILPWQQWASACKNGMLQINHPGKQIPHYLCPDRQFQTVAPSAIPLSPPLDKLFPTPRELTHDEILALIERFSDCALYAKQAGFTAVQFHGAHGYLLSSFLSPKHNVREDAWGGSREKRVRFLQEILVSTRKKVGNHYPVSFKINSSDFQKGGLTVKDMIHSAVMLSEVGLDLIEISGGNYNAPAMMEGPRSSKREAYFASAAKELKKQVKIPVMLTGGIRSLGMAEDILTEGVADVVGLGRGFVLNYQNLVKITENVQLPTPQLTTGLKSLDKLFPLEIIWYTEQLHRVAKGKGPYSKLSPFVAMAHSLRDIGYGFFKRARS
jgi:2,4-dienoyl-CoA reductase-like NADH-dependent reductase (Old Yellow Enzyme family)